MQELEKFNDIIRKITIESQENQLKAIRKCNKKMYYFIEKINPWRFPFLNLKNNNLTWLLSFSWLLKNFIIYKNDKLFYKDFKIYEE